MAVEWSYSLTAAVAEIYLEDGNTVTVKRDNRTGKLNVTWTTTPPHQPFITERDHPSAGNPDHG